MFAKAGIASPTVAFFVSSLDDPGLFFADGTSWEQLAEHWKKFLQTKKVSNPRVVFMEQVHGGAVCAVSDSADARVPGVDALVTNTPGVFVAVKSADCLPVLLFSEDGRAVAAVHAGFRGTLERITEHAVLSLQENFGISPENLSAVLGPAICARCYNVAKAPDDRIARFEAAFGSKMVLREGARVGLDLRGANRYILEQHGVPRDRITDVDDCTMHGMIRYPSHFGRKQSERLISIIGITNGRSNA